MGTLKDRRRSCWSLDLSLLKRSSRHWLCSCIQDWWRIEGARVKRQKSRADLEVVKDLTHSLKPSSTSAFPLAIIMSSEISHPYVFQLFHPICGVRARPLSRARTFEEKAKVTRAVRSGEIILISWRCESIQRYGRRRKRKMGTRKNGKKNPRKNIEGLALSASHDEWPSPWLLDTFPWSPDRQNRASKFEF